MVEWPPGADNKNMWLVKSSTSPSKRDRITKSHAARVLLIALLTGAYFLIPSEAYSLERDPYLFRTLIGKIEFEYEKETATENGKKASDASRFTQTYSLDTRGNLLSRYLIIYDAGVSYSNTGYKTDITNYDITNLNTYLRTTLLPKSAIPLTLYGGYDDQKTTGLDSNFWNKRLTYGLNWFSRLRTLPKITLMAERVHEKTQSTDTLNTLFRVKAEKDIGPTENEIEYIYQYNDDQNSASFSSSSSTNLHNLTHLSSHTTMSIGATRTTINNKVDSATNPQETDITLQGVSLSLSSKPSQEFNQTHNYTFYSNKTKTGTTDGSSYAGDLNYKFSDRLQSHMSLGFSESNEETPTSSSKSKSISTSDSIIYSLTSNLTLSETVEYANTSTNGDTNQLNLGDRSLLRIFTNLAYRKRLDWALMNASYGIGYIEDSTKIKAGGKGVEQDVFLSLADIKINPYVGFGTSARYRNIQALSGNIGGTSYSYGAEAYNRPWRKYAILVATYTKDVNSSWIEVLNSDRTTYKLSAESDYFRNTRLKASAEKIDSFNEISGSTSSTAEEASAEHRRNLFGGNLNALIAFGHSTVKSSGPDQDVSTRLYQLKYTKYLLRSMFWQALFERNERTDQSTFVNNTIIENTLYMPLRSWLFSIEHRYTITDDYQRNLRDNRILLKASRTFFRAY